MTRLLLFAFLVASQGTPPERCSVSGSVVNATTGDPLGGVELLLEPLDRTRSHTATTRSGPDGHFTLVDIDPGSYRLKGLRNGFLDTYYGARRPEIAGTIFKLGEGQALKDLELKLVAPGVIAGTVRNSEGEPLIDVNVAISRISYEGGRRHLEGADSTSTNDLGEYRFWRLVPGTYYVSARPRFGEWKVDHSSKPQGAPVVTLPTFYPGVVDAALAAPVGVAVGARATGIDITLMEARGFRVSGRVAGAAKPTSTSLTLWSRGAELAAPEFEYRTYARNEAGDFEFPSVPAGSYVLLASAWPERSGRSLVEVAGSNLEGLRVTMVPFVEIKGWIATEGESRSRPNVSEVFLTEDGRSGQAGSVAQDNTFTVRNLVPSRYLVRLFGRDYQSQFYIKSMRSGDTDVFQSGLQVTEAGAPPLEIIFASDGGTIEGAVLDEEERTADGATVVLVPDPRRRPREDLFKYATTDQAGRCQFTAIAPGDYKLFAWDDVERYAWLDPGFLKDYEERGKPVTVKPNGSETTNLRLIPVREP